MGTARIYKKGQVTLPKAVREAAGIDVGDRVVIEARHGEIVVSRPRGVLEFEPPQPSPDTRPPWPASRRAARAEHAARRQASDHT